MNYASFVAKPFQSGKRKRSSKNISSTTTAFVQRKKPSKTKSNEVRASSSTNNNQRDESKTTTTTNDIESNMCWFCQNVPAAVLVQLAATIRSIGGGGSSWNPQKQRMDPNRNKKPYCLVCYYSSSAIRRDVTKYVSVYNQSQLDLQLPALQDLFSDVFCELQSELSEESMRAFQTQKKDPLAMLTSTSTPSLYHSRRSRLPSAPKPKKVSGNSISDGGFMRSIPLPERILQTQKEQAKLQAAQVARMNQHTNPTSSTTTSSALDGGRPVNVYKRRKSAKISFWNLALDPHTKALSATDEDMSHLPTCTCGSNDVMMHSNVSSRNQDMRKGETWGMKDRADDVVTRYKCNGCGKMWNED